MKPAIISIEKPSIQQLKACCDIWLEACLVGHDFIAASFWQGKYQDMYEKYLPNSKLHIACEHNLPIGFAATEGNLLAALFVLPEYWGRGAGNALLEKLFALHRFLRLSVYQQNQRAVAFYEKRGFVALGRQLCTLTSELEIAMLWQPAVRGDKG